MYAESADGPAEAGLADFPSNIPPRKSVLGAKIPRLISRKRARILLASLAAAFCTLATMYILLGPLGPIYSTTASTRSTLPPPTLRSKSSLSSHRTSTRSTVSIKGASAPPMPALTPRWLSLLKGRRIWIPVFVFVAATTAILLSLYFSGVFTSVSASSSQPTGQHAAGTSGVALLQPETPETSLVVIGVIVFGVVFFIMACVFAPYAYAVLVKNQDISAEQFYCGRWRNRGVQNGPLNGAQGIPGQDVVSVAKTQIPDAQRCEDDRRPKSVDERVEGGPKELESTGNVVDNKEDDQKNADEPKPADVPTKADQPLVQVGPGAGSPCRRTMLPVVVVGCKPHIGDDSEERGEYHRLKLMFHKEVILKRLFARPKKEYKRMREFEYYCDSDPENASEAAEPTGGTDGKTKMATIQIGEYKCYLNVERVTIPVDTDTELLNACKMIFQAKNRIYYLAKIRDSVAAIRSDNFEKYYARPERIEILRAILPEGIQERINELNNPSHESEDSETGSEESETGSEGESILSTIGKFFS